AALQAQCPHEIARSACYEHFRTLGLEYGSSFQGIARLWQGDGQALARVEVPAELHATLADFNAHPAVLDVCFQTPAAALPMQQLYQPDWIEQERGAPRNEPQPGVWLVHGGSAELSASTLAALRQAGNTALAVHDDKGFRVSAQGLHVNGVDESSWLQLLVH